jgi:hypothetical protein
MLWLADRNLRGVIMTSTRQLPTYSTAPHLVEWDLLYMYLGCWRVPLLLAMVIMTTMVIIMMFCDGHDDINMASRELGKQVDQYHRVGRSLNSVYRVRLIHRTCHHIGRFSSIDRFMRSNWWTSSAIAILRDTTTRCM